MTFLNFLNNTFANLPLNNPTLSTHSVNSSIGQIALPLIPFIQTKLQNTQNHTSLFSDFKSLALSLHYLIHPFILAAPYKLSPKASISDKIIYCLFRIWNAVKSIFNMSDWQRAKKELATNVMSPQNIFNAFNSYKGQTKKGDVKTFNQIQRALEMQADAFLYLSIDNKIEKLKDDQQRDKLYDKILAVMTDCFVNFYGCQNLTNVSNLQDLLPFIGQMIDNLDISQEVDDVFLSKSSNIDKSLEKIIKVSSPIFFQIIKEILDCTEVNGFIEMTTKDAMQKGWDEYFKMIDILI